MLLMLLLMVTQWWRQFNVYWLIVTSALTSSCTHASPDCPVILVSSDRWSVTQCGLSTVRAAGWNMSVDIITHPFRATTRRREIHIPRHCPSPTVACVCSALEIYHLSRHTLAHVPRNKPLYTHIQTATCANAENATWLWHNQRVALKWHLIPSSGFSTLHECDRRTDRPRAVKQS